MSRIFTYHLWGEGAREAEGEGREAAFLEPGEGGEEGEVWGGVDIGEGEALGLEGVEDEREELGADAVVAEGGGDKELGDRAVIGEVEDGGEGFYRAGDVGDGEVVQGGEEADVALVEHELLAGLSEDAVEVGGVAWFVAEGVEGVGAEALELGVEFEVEGLDGGEVAGADGFKDDEVG